MTEPGQIVTSARQGSVAILTVNNPPVNALSHGVRAGLKTGLDAALADAGVTARGHHLRRAHLRRRRRHHRVRQAARGARPAPP